MRTFPIVALLAVLALAACGNKDQAAPAGPGDDITGRYVVTSITEGGRARTLEPGTEFRIVIRPASIGFSAGCNSMGADYTRDGDTLSLGQTAGTLMACRPALMEQDRWVEQVFSRPIRVAGDPLTITSGDVVLTLTPREQGPAPLVGTRWALDGVKDGDSVAFVPAGPEVVLSLSDAGEARITGLCNGWAAEVEVFPRSISWTPGARTEMACLDVARNRLDADVASLLTGTTRYSVDEGLLTITRGEQGLVFRAQPE